MEDIIKVLEKYKLADSIKVLRKEMAASKQSQMSEDSVLAMIRKSIVNKEKRKLREETKQLQYTDNNYANYLKDLAPDNKKSKAQGNASFNKEETEAIMEKLMNRIVANPKLINEDSDLNQRIEKIFNLEAFQKMVENADIFQDLSSSSIFSNSQILQKSMLSQNTPMQQILQPASMNESSEIADSNDFVEELLNKDHDDSLLKIDKESVRTEHTRGDQKATKTRKEDKQKKPEPLHNDKTHTTSHEEKVPMKNQDTKFNIEESKKVSQRISDDLKSHQEESKKDVKKYKTNTKLIDEYKDDEDAGFRIIEVEEKNLKERCKQIADEYNYPERAFKPSTDDDMKRIKAKKVREKEEEAKRKAINDKRQAAAEESKDNEEAEGEEDDIPTLLPKWVKFTSCEDDFYPAEFNGVVYD